MQGYREFLWFSVILQVLIVKAQVWHPVVHLAVLVDYNPLLQKREFFLWIISNSARKYGFSLIFITLFLFLYYFCSDGGFL